MSNTPLKIVVVGHVDHGKSTLVGRLLHETGALPEGKVEYLKEVCDKRGMPFEWAFVMDALQAERDQGITIDTSQLRFHTGNRPVLIIDAPGHKEFLKNMITGAASAEAAVLVIDAHEGVQEQSRRHGYLLHLLGLTQIAVAVNKMDLVDWSEARFQEVEAEIRAYLGGIGVTPTHVVPVSARGGDNINAVSEKSAWYKGPSVIGALDGFAAAAVATDLALRLPVQDVYKFDSRRIISGRIESGRIKVGDRLTFSPSGKSARVASIEGWAGSDITVLSAGAGQSVGVTLDEPIFVERGQVAHLAEAAPALAHEIRARVFWLGRDPLALGDRLKLKLATAEYHVEVAAIEKVIDVEDLGSHQGAQVGRNAVAELVFRSRGAMAFDTFGDNARLGRFVLVHGYDIVGGGIVGAAMDNRNIFHVDHQVTSESRARANGHKGGVLWLTGLSGAGKSTIAMELERRLFQKGWQVNALDGDNVRHGLCSDLGFSPEDRSENIRRVGEIGHLFARAGMLVITAFISPYRADRDRVRAIDPEAFHEIHVATGLDECERRDPKGLYKKARKGEIIDFTGVSAPYEAPENPELTLNTDGKSVEETVSELVSYVEAQFGRNAVDTMTAWTFRI
ncbi:Adenylylsulphate kinase [Magnetospirillum gryphiswaldense MSR-1 v2]|uniref:Adenylyl-sulfate kinase n=1 Tax=Magnetospirillum gryphiswaldense (strain DSM 6361 / JCM 21280 / NBRC 15271 / MSR-1) TaxID=431944 RepID=V6F048_MAGGM|nr:adenylyl-sulfate kinase [Magnetospirillum gryphiswaldense]CDK97686.1 Adenylylsulphate kinase [Magnetospirillum gryphiswaldense MSR-1 v2]